MKDNNTKNWKKVREEAERIIDEEENLAQSEEELQAQQKAEGSEFAENVNLLEHPAYVELAEKLTLTERQSFENREQLMRAKAEIDNMRMRAEKDIANAHRFGIKDLVSALLPVIDSLEQALQLADKHAQNSMLEGLELTLKLFLDALQKNNVEQIDPLGEMFNPEEHEAMSVQEAIDVPSNSIIMVIQKGYKLNGRVIRAARVIIAKA